MKIENFQQAEKLFKILNELQNALYYTERYISSFESARPDSGGANEDFEHGYKICLGEHRDLSGNSLDLSGCYVEQEVVHATKKVLEDKIVLCKSHLTKLGVIFEDA